MPIGLAESAHAATSYPKYFRCKPGFWSHGCVAGPVHACSDHTVRVDIASLPNSYKVYLGDSQWTTNDAWYASTSGC
jgi:hypothetical protein